MKEQNLAEALHTKQYMAEANEAESWMLEKEPILASKDYGKDEDSAEVGNFSIVFKRRLCNTSCQEL